MLHNIIFCKIIGYYGLFNLNRNKQDMEEWGLLSNFKKFNSISKRMSQIITGDAILQQLGTVDRYILFLRAAKNNKFEYIEKLARYIRIEKIDIILLQGIRISSEMCIYLVKKCGLNPQQVFQYLCKMGDANCAKFLLENYDIDPSYKNNEALNFAVRYAHMSIILLLASHPKIKMNRILSDRILWNIKDWKYEEVMKLLELESIRDILDKETCESLLLYLISNRCKEGIHNILSLLGKYLKKFDILQANIYLGNIEIVKEILQSGTIEYTEFVDILNIIAPLEIENEEMINLIFEEIIKIANGTIDLSKCLSNIYSYGNFTVIKILIEKYGVDIKLEDLEKASIKYKNYDLWKYLLDNNHPVVDRILAKLFLIVWNSKNIDTIELLLKSQKLDLSNFGTNHFINMVDVMENLENFELIIYIKFFYELFNKNEIYNKVDHQLIFEKVCATRILELIDFFLKSPYVNPAKDGQNILEYHCDNNNYKVVEILLKHRKINPSIDNFRIIRKVERQYGRRKCLKLLLKRLNKEELFFYCLNNRDLGDFI